MSRPVRTDVRDRRCYPYPNDADRTLDAFAAQLREQIDRGALQHTLVGVVYDTVQPAQATVGIREAAR